MTYYPQIGSVSEGTMRDDDLLDTLSSELSYHMKRLRLSHETRKRFNALLRDVRNYNPDNDAAEIEPGIFVSELFDALSEIAAPYCYFGASEGDGACYGFWPCNTDDMELPKINAGDSIPRECWGDDVLIVNDHGNVECGHVTKRGKFKAYWSIV